MLKLKIPQNALAVASLALSPHIPGGLEPKELLDAVTQLKTAAKPFRTEENTTGLMTLKDAAKLLALSERTVWNYARSGRIKAVRLSKGHSTSAGRNGVGGSVRYPRIEILAVAAGRM